MKHDPALLQAKAALDAGDLVAAEQLSAELLRARPRDFDARMLMADVLHAQRRLAEEVTHIESAVRLEPKNARLRTHLGQRLITLNRYQKALAQFDRALKLNPRQSSAVAGKAAIFESRGQYQKARALLQPHLAGAATPPAVASVFLRILTHDGEIDRAIELGRAVAGAVAAEKPTPALSRMFFALAKACEKGELYEEAFAAAAKANAIAAVPYDPNQTERSIEAYIEIFSKEAMRSLPRSSEPSERAVFIVGMPRCGSTLLERILHAHQDGFGAGEMGTINALFQPSLHEWLGLKTPYPNCIPALTADHLTLIGQHYLQQLPRAARDAKRVANKELWNFLHLGLITLALPGARVIHCRRNALDTCVSCFFENLPAATAPFATDLRRLGHYYRQYERIMDHWREAGDPRLLEIDYEELTSEQEEVTHRVITFLGLPWDDRCLRFHELKREEGTLSYDQVRRPMYRTSVGRAERFGSLLDPLREALQEQE